MPLLVPEIVTGPRLIHGALWRNAPISILCLNIFPKPLGTVRLIGKHGGAGAYSIQQHLRHGYIVGIAAREYYSHRIAQRIYCSMYLRTTPAAAYADALIIIVAGLLVRIGGFALCFRSLF